MAKTSSTHQVDMSAAALRKHYADEAARLGLITDHNDELLVEQACATVELIAKLQRSIDTDGAMSTSATGKVERNPAVVEIRQQRLTLAKLTQLVENRFALAAAGGKNTSRGTQAGAIRGPYAGDGGQRVAGTARKQTRPRRAN